MKVRKVSWSYSSATFHTTHIPYVLLYIIVGVCWGDCHGGGEGHGGSQGHGHGQQPVTWVMEVSPDEIEG